MQGVVLYGPRDVRFEEREVPKITKPTDAVIRLSATRIRGSDLWPYRGIQPIAKPTPMGHEYCGIVEEVGKEVKKIKPGQFVVGSFATSDNTCLICKDGYQSSCVRREFMSAAQGNECAVQFLWLLAHEQEPPLLVDVCLAWIVALAQRGTGCKKSRVSTGLLASRNVRGAFPLPVKFKATQNALVFSKSDMDLPFVTYNADLLTTVAPQLEAELAQQLAQKTFREQAKSILKQLLAGQRPGYRIWRERST